MIRVFLTVALAAILVACGGSSTSTTGDQSAGASTAAAAGTAAATQSPTTTPTMVPTTTPQPTSIPEPTPTPVPTPTPLPTPTPVPTPTPEPTPTPVPTPTGPKTTFGDGTYLVGKDIAPGLYWTVTTDSCYFARLAGFGGSIDDIIANDNATGQAIVLVQDSDAGFESHRCGQWENITSLPVRTDPTAPFSDGTFKVGDQVAAGTWRNDSGDSCYWERLSGFGSTLDDITANGIVSAPTIVTINPSDQGFNSHRCGTWTMVSP